MSNKIEIKLDSVDVIIDQKDKTIRLFDWGAMEAVEFYFNDWDEIKSVIDTAINKPCNDKRQPIKEQTLDEFNNARQVAYGKYIQVEPLTDQ